MGRLLDWSIDKRQDVQELFEQKNPPCQPPDEWWIEVFALASVVETINTTFRVLQGQQRIWISKKSILKTYRKS
jgi:hypothetical protein